MRLMHPLFSEPIVFSENRIPVLVIENPVVFRNMTAELVGQGEGEDGQYVLSVNYSPIDASGHINVILDFVHLKEVEKRLQTKAINALLKTARESLAQEIHSLTMEIRKFLSVLAACAEFPAAYEESENIQEILKAMNFHVDLEGLPAHEAVYEQMSLMESVSKNQLYVLVNAKSFFSEQELRQLYQMTTYRKMRLFMLEAQETKRITDFETVTVFDRDLCEIKLAEEGEIG